jgi:hypothetical protein
MAVETTVKTIGTTGTFSTPQLWEDGGPANLTTAERSACGTFAIATFVQGEGLTFVGSGATGTMLDTDSTGPGTGTYMTYGITAGNPAASDVITGTSTATCILTSGTPDFTGVIWQGQCQNQEFVGAGTVILNITGSTASATAYKHITTVAGASFRDHANVQTNPLRYDATTGCGFRTTGAAGTIALIEAPSRASKIQCQRADATGTCFSLSTTAVQAEFMLIEGFYTGVSTTVGVVSAAATNYIFKNSIVVQRSSGADHLIGTGTATGALNVNITFVAPDDLAAAPVSIFLSGASGSFTARNCGFFLGDATKAIHAGSATPTYTTCYTDTNSPPAGVTQTTYGTEFQNVNDATRDFRLVTGAAQKDTGTTDTTHAAIDIAGTARPSGAAYDVGAWEFVPAGAGGAHLLITVGSGG